MKLWTKVFWLHYFNLCVPISIMLWMAHFVQPHITPGLYTMPLWAPIILYILTALILLKK